MKSGYRRDTVYRRSSYETDDSVSRHFDSTVNYRVFDSKFKLKFQLSDHCKTLSSDCVCATLTSRSVNFLRSDHKLGYTGSISLYNSTRGKTTNLCLC
jgi:hypothetical protein